MDAELNELLNEVTEIKKELISILNLINCHKLNKEWYTDEECFNLRGGGSLNTYRSNRFYQCKGGIPDARINGRNAWNKKSVCEWMVLTDNELEAYHQKYKTGAKRK